VRLAIILPIVQFLLAVTLLHWGRGYQLRFPLGPQLVSICFGLNAPALPLYNFPRLFDFVWGHKLAWMYGSIFGLGVDDLFFLCGVIALWCFAGRVLERRASRMTRPGKITAFVVCPFVLLFALGLATTALFDLGPGRIKELDPPLGAFLTGIWAAILMFLAGKQLLVAIWKRQPAEIRNR
jgi:hypothetical protein